MSKEKHGEGIINGTNSDIGFHEEILDEDFEHQMNIKMQKLIREHRGYPLLDENGTMAMIRNGKGKNIRSVQDWFEYAPPAKRNEHWVDCRSAKELAKAWFKSGGPKIPKELLELLASSECTSDFKMKYAIPELKTRLDKFGAGRNHDLVILGEAKCGRTLIAIEAKVNETFGKIISKYLAETVGASTKVPERIKYLSEGIFGHQNIGYLRYQLLHAVAGTLIAAAKEEASQCIFVVHEMVPRSGKSLKALSNNSDLEAFVKLLTGSKLETGNLIGPIPVPGNKKEHHEDIPSNILLYIGKFQTTMPDCDNTGI